MSYCVFFRQYFGFSPSHRRARVRDLLKKQKGAPLQSGKRFCNKNRSQKRSTQFRCYHQRMQATSTGSKSPSTTAAWWQCRAAPSGHPGPASRPALRTGPAAPRPGQCPGAGEHGRQDDDAGGLRAGWGRLHHDADALRVRRDVPAPWAVWSRRHPPWAPSCAVSAGGMSANWTG